MDRYHFLANRAIDYLDSLPDTVMGAIYTNKYTNRVSRYLSKDK
jgi:hypothetical protein